jgi:hypothetical protein
VGKEYVANARHLQENISYYARERIVRIAFTYAEVAAFIRSLIGNGVDLGELIRSMGERQ